MATLVYAPSVEIHIQTVSGKIYDVSGDITEFTVTRIINGVSNVQFSLQNAGRKYDGVFTEMDKVAVYLTRIKRLLVFTGYLDMVPAFTSTVTTVNLSASCTLKRLQNWPWDPTTSAANALLYDAPNVQAVKTFDMTDGGLAARTINVLTQVCGWPKAQIHIGAIPKDWFASVARVAEEIIDEANQLDMIAQVGSTAYLGGSTTFQEGTQTIPGIGPGTGTLPNLSGSFGLYSAAADRLDSRARPPSGAYYCTMRWPYLALARTLGGMVSGVPSPAPGVDVTAARGWWQGRNLLLVNPANSKAVCVTACGWGPGSGGTNDHPVIGSTSAQALSDLGANGNAVDVHVAFAPAGMKPGAIKSTGDPTQGQALQSADSGSGSSAVQMANTAAQWGLSSGVDYGWGAGHPAEASDPHPAKLDCSGLVNWSLARIGKSQLGTSRDYAAAVTRISLDEARKTKGALLFLGSSPAVVHHVGISMGDGTTAEARDTGGNVGTYPFSGPHANSWDFAGRLPELDYTGAIGSGTGGTPGKYSGGSGGGSPTPGGGTGTTSLDGDIGTSLYNVWQWVGNHSFAGDLLAGSRALMNDEPVLKTIDSLLTTGLRQYSSAPNGDFISWFPDYFGWYGTAGKMIVEPIEIKRGFVVARSDQTMRTHWYVTSATTGIEGAGDATSIAQEYATAGIASVQMPALMKALFRVGSEFDDQGAAFLARYGARPQFEPMDNISGHQQEFFFAVTRFTQNWAARWTAPVPLTFMPEVWPGMLLCFPRYGVQCYVQEVVHRGKLSRDGGFSTQVSGVAWSTLGSRKGISGMPIGAPVA